MSALTQLAQALDAAKAAGYTVTWGEYAHGTEYISLTDDGRRVYHKCIVTDTDERTAANAINAIVERQTGKQ